MDYNEFRKHPRILELRFSLIHSNFVMNFGMEKTAELFQSLCEVSYTNWTVLSSVISRKSMITNLNITNRMRYRQEVVFMGMVYGESQIHTVDNYLRFSKRLLYESYDGMLIPSRFLNQEWIDQLDYNTVVAGVPAYALEITRFLNYLTMISEVFSGVSMAKI